MKLRWVVCIVIGFMCFVGCSDGTTAISNSTANSQVAVSQKTNQYVDLIPTDVQSDEWTSHEFSARHQSPNTFRRDAIRVTTFTYPSTGIEMFDPWPSRSDATELSPQNYDDYSMIRKACADRATIPTSVRQQDVIAAFIDEWGYTRLTLQGSGTFTYSESPGCMYSYRGFEGQWHLEGNQVQLCNAKPDISYSSLFSNAPPETSCADPFLTLGVRQLDGEVVLVVMEGKSFARGLFRRTVER